MLMHAAMRITRVVYGLASPLVVRRSCTACNHMIRLLVSTQEPEALSSGESGWYGLGRSGCAAVGFSTMAKDFGIVLKPRLAGDATAAAGIARRRGAGKIRHIETNTLWLQRKSTSKQIELRRIPGKELVADLGTKHMTAANMIRLVEDLGYVYRKGVSGKALKPGIGTY